ncbi:hypothetical protein BAUCODRAFT_482112 [Baudoinia panamericana UAMH 10762]|uniref:Uncharacterized protein n=1 Tax=Baudoinia panamericana (strain UAMH 10762) TaxID=717646 RepID=M2MYD3_BAUPA|nr:uncharacterized protein BAUCODRAFT_482112 [Baudoinia panamericana UAMH 10762]EMC96583.1 hypothetical protein BAUCODRAFT_482112 [Baudoinia panamericana UAMH 10762]
MDIATIKDFVSDMVKCSVSNIRAEIKSVVDAFINAINKRDDIAGMKELILANASVVMPIIRPEEVFHVISPSTGRRVTSLPELFIIIRGTSPNLKCHVVFADVNGATQKKAGLLSGNVGATVHEAMANLLKASSQLVEEKLYGEGNIIGQNIRQLDHGSYNSDGLEDSPVRADRSVSL